MPSSVSCECEVFIIDSFLPSGSESLAEALLSGGSIFFLWSPSNFNILSTIQNYYKLY